MVDNVNVICVVLVISLSPWRVPSSKATNCVASFPDAVLLVSLTLLSTLSARPLPARSRPALIHAFFRFFAKRNSRFPRMKAMRCYSASLKCGPLPAAAAAATATAAAAASGSDVSPGDELSESVTRTKKGRRGDKKMSLPSSPSSSTSSTSSTSSSLSLSSSSTAATGCGVDRPAPIPFASEEACPLPCQGRGEWDTRRTKLEAESATAARGPMFGKEMEEEMMMTPGGLRLDDLLAIADCDPPGAVLVDTGLQTCW